jgi:hypothetical protein
MAPGAPNGANGTIDAPGGPLPVRSPGNHPLGPGAPGNGAPGNGAPANGGPVFGADPFGSDNAFGSDSTFTDDFATTRMPAVGGDGGSVGTGPVPSAPPAGTVNGLAGSDGSQVTIPTVGASTDQRLPIFDSLESDWFRRSGKSTSSTAAPAAAGQTWNSPADEGYRAAQVAAIPEAGETTTAGLPKRVPRANLVPGSVGGTEQAEDAQPVRSADTIRSRMSSFQRGVREARAAGPLNEEP